MRLLCCAVGMLALVHDARAGLVLFASRAAFNAAYPVQSFEDFEEAQVPPGGSAAMTGPLNAATSNAIFLPGQIVAGLSISTNTPFTDNLFVSSAGFANYTSKAISYNFPGTGSPELTAALSGGSYFGCALDVTSNPAGQSVTVSFYSGAVLLGSQVVVGTGAGTFLGVTADEPITSVTLTAPTDYFGFDNIAFAVPAPGAAGLLLAAFCTAARRNRRMAP